MSATIKKSTKKASKTVNVFTCVRFNVPAIRKIDLVVPVKAKIMPSIPKYHVNVDFITTDIIKRRASIVKSMARAHTRDLTSASLFSFYAFSNCQNYRVERAFETFHTWAEIVTIAETSERYAKKQLKAILDLQGHRCKVETSGASFRVVLY